MVYVLTFILHLMFDVFTFVVAIDLDALMIYYVIYIILSTTIISDLSEPV